MNNLNYPLKLTFKIITFTNELSIVDSLGHILAYTRQKIFALKEDISVFADNTQTNLIYKIKADRILDWNARYTFTDATGRLVGAMKRDGLKSIFKARYAIFDENNNLDLEIQEENAWITFFDSLFDSIIISYFFNPTYIVKRPNGTIVAKMKKERSLFERGFSIIKISDFEDGEETRLLLAQILVSIIERSRG